MRPCESVDVGLVIKRKAAAKEVQDKLQRGTRNLILALAVFVARKYELVSRFLPFGQPFVPYFEVLALITFSLNCLVNFLQYLSLTLGFRTLSISEGQARLLKVTNQNVRGITVATSVASSPSQNSPVTVTQFRPHYSSFTPPSRWSPTTPQSVMSSSLHSSLGSASYIDTSLDSSFVRLRNSTGHRRSTGYDDHISDSTSLNRFVREQEELEEQYQRTMRLSPQQQHLHFDSSGRSPDLPLGKYQAGVLSSSPSVRDEEDSFGHSTTRSEEVWQQLKINKSDLELWTENCRKWISVTLVKRLATEIDAINATLVSIGSRDIQIGSVSLSTLRQIATVKSQQVPSLAVVVPYLEVFTNQEYLVQRIRDLSRGDSLNCYRWNSGGRWNGRGWDNELPNDTQILLHLVCTYLDARLPPNPRQPDRKAFSTHYVIRAPSKHDPKKKEREICLYQTRTNPPHMKVVIRNAIVDVPKGRNNFFHSLIAFLHHLKVEEKGMLGRTNLSLSGLNILTILELD
ncbi:transmembrane protein 209-like [Corticium candelabrum]|uniref:transmembrane protein 209-like n=1 Tax=Corticium candelabrum TaxID=121492 RepID=UPI002E257B6B|nr:transmembrane protein 209-like [Corticium candelabrum]